MKVTAIACKTIEDEVNKAVENSGGSFKIHWIESGLHYHPEKLKNTLQECIDKISDSKYILLLFGLCGNALLGLESKTATLVIPKVDDCISLMLGGNDQRKCLETTSRAYYLTKGWLRYDINIWHEYKRSIDLYGIEVTHKIFQDMLKHYTHIAVIDTGAYDTGTFVNETNLIADEFGLEHKVIKGEMSYLSAALDEKWDNRFALIEPGQKVTIEMMNYIQS